MCARKAEKDEGEKKAPGEALKHGLEEKDLVGLGKFVNKKLAEGLRGTELAEAIHKEADKRKEERKKEREAEKAQKGKAKGKEKEEKVSEASHGEKKEKGKK